jgi:hypothetical protein
MQNCGNIDGLVCLNIYCGIQLDNQGDLVAAESITILGLSDCVVKNSGAIAANTSVVIDVAGEILNQACIRSA